MKIVEFLKKGDIVDIVAPSSAAPMEEVDAGVQYLKELGLVPRMPETLFKGRNIFYACDDTEAIRQLKSAFYAKDSKAVWCVRGGSGAGRLLPKIQSWKAPKVPKWFIGLSDVTVLHALLVQKWKWPTVHGPLLFRMGTARASELEKKELEDLLFGRNATLSFSGLKPLNAAARKLKKIRAPMLGGNLTVIESMVKTGAEIKGRGNIIFVEDVGERGYRIDRNFYHLEQAGLFTGAKAVVFGDFLGGEEKDGVSQVPAALELFAQRMKLPVFSGVASGHGPVQRPVPFGVPAILTHSEENGELSIDWPVAKRTK